MLILFYKKKKDVVPSRKVKLSLPIIESRFPNRHIWGKTTLDLPENSLHSSEYINDTACTAFCLFSHCCRNVVVY